MSSAIQWLIIITLITSIPIVYLRTTNGKPASLTLRITSYVGAVVLGGVISTLLLGLKIIGIPWVIFVVLVFVIAHRTILARLRQDKKS